MKKQEIEHRMSEAADVLGIISRTIESAELDLSKAENSKEEVVKILSDVSNFSKDVISSSSGMKEEDRLRTLSDALDKIGVWAASESDRIRMRSNILKERIAALKSVSGFMNDRINSYDARAKAIERAADPDRDKRHPEKLSVKRSISKDGES